MPADGGCYCPRRLRTKTAMAGGWLWEVVLYEGGHVEIYPVGHDTDPETLSMADDKFLQDLVLPAEQSPGYDPDPYHNEADDRYQDWKDRQAAA